MAASKRTKNLKKAKCIFYTLDILFYIGFTIVMVFTAFSHLGSGKEPSHQVFSEDAIRIMTSLATTAVIGIAATIFIKERVRPALFMADMVIASLTWGTNGMYIAILIWALDEYLVHALYVHFKSKVSINKEIDRREQ